MAFDRQTAFLVKLCLGAITFAAAVYMLDWRKVADALDQLSTGTLVFAMLIILSEFPFLAWRWHLIAREQSSAPALRHVESYFIATFLGTFTPGHIGSDAYRFASLRAERIRPGGIFTMLLRERLLGLVGYLLVLIVFLIGALSVDTGIRAQGRDALIVCALLSGAAFATIMAGRTIIRFARVFSRGRFHAYVRDLFKLVDRALRVHSAREAAQLLGLTVIGDIGQWVLAFYIVASSFGIEISFFLIGAITIMVELIRLIPITVQGIGVREAAFAGLFGLMGQDPAVGFTICAICFVLLNLVTLVVGLAGYALAFSHRRPNELDAGASRRRS